MERKDQGGLGNGSTMNTLRMRLAKLDPNFGANTEYSVAMQLSMDGLYWWTVGRFRSMEDAIQPAKDLEKFIKDNFTVKATHVLWAAKI